MRIPRSFLFVLVALLLVMVAACSGPPETQVVLVVSPTHEPATMTALAVEVSGATPEPDTATQAPDDGATATETPTEVILDPTATPTLGPFPTPLVTQIQVAEQVFEHGRMFWLQPNREIWVMINDPDDENRGRWIIAEDTFEEGEMEYDPSVTPPVDGLQPERGFGKLWRENEDIRDALGWGVTPEFGFVTTYEYRAGGYLNSDGEYVAAPGIHILVSLSNEAFAFEETDFTWRLIE